MANVFANCPYGWEKSRKNVCFALCNCCVDIPGNDPWMFL